jgi:hypothetical protein
MSGNLCGIPCCLEKQLLSRLLLAVAYLAYHYNRKLDVYYFFFEFGIDRHVQKLLLTKIYLVHRNAAYL